jgi:hypothetical protein
MYVPSYLFTSRSCGTWVLTDVLMQRSTDLRYCWESGL